MFGFYNMISVIFGIIALLLPLPALFHCRRTWLSYGSMASAMASLVSQLAAYNTLVRKSDWSALLDTSDFTLIASVSLTVIILLLNLILLIKHK